MVFVIKGKYEGEKLCNHTKCMKNAQKKSPCSLKNYASSYTMKA